jgi:hypothetical protein
MFVASGGVVIEQSTFSRARESARIRTGGSRLCREPSGMGEYRAGVRRVQVEIDNRLLVEIRRLAKELGRSERELLNDVAPDGLRESARRSGSLEELFERIDRGQTE